MLLLVLWRYWRHWIQICLGLRKYSPSLLFTSAACNCRLSWWAF